jgi:hypothetical protein
MTFEIVQFGFTVGVTLVIASGIVIAIVVVGDPSQPCPTPKVRIESEPAAVDVAVTPTWALADSGAARASRRPDPRAEVVSTAVRFIGNSF